MTTHTLRRRYTPAANFVGMIDRDHCAVQGCVRRPHHFGAPYCVRHAKRALHHGHVDATIATIRELAQFTDWISHGLDLYRNTPAVKIALARAHRLLHFTPQTGAAWELYFAGRMAAVRQKAGRPVDARRLLVTALTYFAFEQAHPERVQTTTVRDIGLARSLISWASASSHSLGRRTLCQVAYTSRGSWACSPLGSFRCCTSS